jgi:HEAT repeat protein
MQTRARRPAGRSLPSLDDAGIVPPLLAALPDGQRSVRISVARALYVFLDDAWVTETLARSWNDAGEAERLLEPLWDEVGSVRAAAAWALGVARTPHAVEPLLAMLNERNAEVQSRIVWALGRIAAPWTVPPLWQGMPNAPPPGPWPASAPFALFPDARIVAALRGMRQDEDATVRQQAAAALNRIRLFTGEQRTGAKP